MKYVSLHKIEFLIITILVAAVSLASVHIHNSNASFHTFDDLPSTFPSFLPIPDLQPPPTITSGSSRPLVSPSSTFQDCIKVICKGITAFTPEFNQCLQKCFSGQKTSSGNIIASSSISSTSALLSSISSASPSFSSASPSSISIPIPNDQPFCIDAKGERTFDRILCASPTVQGTVLFPSRDAPLEPIDDLIATFLGVPIQPLPITPLPSLPDHDPLEILTTIYTIFQRLPEFLKIFTESAIVTSVAMDQAYQGYRDARLELLNARTQCAEFYQTPGRTPCTVALRSSIYALGKIRISTESILRQDIQVSARIAALFTDLTTQWNKNDAPKTQIQPSIEHVPGQPFLE